MNHYLAASMTVCYSLCMKYRGYSFFLIGLAGCLVLPPASLSATPYVQHQEPEYVTFAELKILSENPKPGGALEEKLNRLWTTPIIDNGAWYRGARPRKFINEKLGHTLTVGSWNIEKSYYIPEVIELFKSESAFKNKLDPHEAGSETRVEKILRQRKRLIQADILIFQEMDIGHKRSGYLNAAQELADALDMNYVYGSEYLEVDPVYLGTETLQNADGSAGPGVTEHFKPDPQKYKGMFGSAVLSRYPIKNAQVFLLKNQPYDWHAGEKPKPALIEESRRFGSSLIFQNTITREMKVGGRIFFRVDLDVPELPGGTLTVINIHLEIKCLPKGREDQMAEILSYIKDIKNPVIVMGDFNAAPNDISPTSATRIITRTAKNPSTWVNAAVSFLTPYGPANVFRNVSNATKNLQDPTTANIKILAPNKVKPLFDMLENYRFSDGTTFDFRGDASRSVTKKRGKLSNSNQRDFKGFKTTFQVKRPIAAVIGKLRLDWTFVRSGYLRDPFDSAAPYKFAPHFGETLEELNISLAEPISDHHPNVIDLPFEEPEILNKEIAENASG